MLEAGTWIAVAILGPGAVAIMVWFLLDIRRILPAVEVADLEPMASEAVSLGEPAVPVLAEVPADAVEASPEGGRFSP